MARDLLDYHAPGLREPRQPLGRRTPAHTVAFLTDRDHPRWRAILDTVLTARSSATFERGVSGTLHEELEKAVARSQGSDLDPRPAIQHLTAASLYRAFFGLRPGDPRLHSLRQAFRAIPPHRPELHVDRVTPLIDIIRSSGREMVEGSPAADPASVLGCILRVGRSRAPPEVRHRGQHGERRRVKECGHACEQPQTEDQGHEPPITNHVRSTGSATRSRRNGGLSAMRSEAMAPRDTIPHKTAARTCSGPGRGAIAT